MKKILSLFIALVFVVTAFPLGAIATMAADAGSTDAPVISVESVSTFAGKSVNVNVNIKNNPGIISAALTFSYSEGLTLVGATNGDAFSTLSFTKPGVFKSPCNFVWDSSEVEEDDIKDGTILTLTFEVAEDIEEGTDLVVNVSYSAGNIIDNNLNVVKATTIGGVVSVIDYIPGDLNNDGLVTTMDLVYFRRHMAGGYDITIVEAAADVNGDGNITVLDLTLIRRYLAGGYGVDLTPSQKKCDHSFEYVAAKVNTCTVDGNIDYWHCIKCDKCYLDDEGAAEVALANTVIEAPGHTAVIDPAVQPTYTTTGLTEGSHCSVCGEVIVPQNVIPMLQKNEYSITYHIANNDTYLAGLSIENPNSTTYTTEDGLWLEDLIVPGYTFEGWYDGAGSNGSLVKEIPAGAKGNKTLYAKWTKTVYTVQFESDLIPVDDITYTVDQGRVLPVPELNGYTFVGWSDGDGKILKKIPAGETGTKTYKANWLSERNQAWAYNEVGAPIIYEDDETILMIYEIGEIRNVPLQVIQDFGKINSDGVEKTVTKTYKITTSKTEMENYTNTVSKATTESFGWTLSSEWTDSVSVTEEWAEEHGMTVEEAEEVCTNESSNWYVSSGSSSTDTTEKIESTDTSTLQTTTKNNKSYDSATIGARQDFSAEVSVNTKVSTEVSAKAEVPGFGEAGTSLGSEVSTGVTAKSSTSLSADYTTGSESESGSSSESGKVVTSGKNTTNSATFNSESGCGGSSSVTNTSSVSKAIAETISQKTGYGKEYIQSENNEETMDTSSSNESSDEYSAGVTYSIEESEEITETYTTSNTKSGYHRWVIAGTAHVFAVVGYDIATDSYFVTTYSVMDDETHQFEDYSYSYASYDDNQNSVIPFEVPVDMQVYVHDRIGKTQGLEVSKSGIITGYTGTDEMVIIPEYTRVENLDGTFSVIKVVGISENAFAGNETIKAVMMSDFITTIPDRAFENCTSLLYFEGASINSIGDYAFKGCTSLKHCELGENVTSLGVGTFEGMDSFVIIASKAAIVNAALKSGAKNIVIGVGDSCTDLNNMTLTVPATAESFTFYGYGKTYDNLIIESNATSVTNIYRATLNSTGKTPLKLASATVTMQEVTATAPGIALMLLADSTSLVLYGESFITSEGENAVLSKNVAFSQYKAGYYSHLTATGKYLICGEIKNSSYLTVVANAEERIIPITSTMFDKYAAGAFKITFDANGGTIADADAERECFYGTEIGALPVLKRDYYTFDGWFTAAEGGEEVTAETTFETVENVTVYAHWTLNKTSDWVLSTEIPDGAQIVDEKWTYDLTTNITSDVAEVEGYELYDTTSKWGEYGEWTAWSKTAATGSDSVQVETKTVTDTAAYTNYRYWIYRSSDHRTYGTKGYNGVANTYYEINLKYALSLKDSGNKLYGDYTTGCHSWCTRWFFGESKYVPAVTHTEYRYRVRELIYTYYLTKTEAMESDTEVTASETVSNVHKWVQYRAK